MEIKASEISRGNYVIIYNQIETVYSNLFDYDEGADYINDKHISLIKPIPLTEQWLIDLGFDKTNNLNYEKEKFIIWTNLKTRKLNYRLQFHESIEIIFVHRLQNLYHSLTGKELTK